MRSDRSRRRERAGRVAVVLALPLLLAMGCTEPVEPDGADVGTDVPAEAPDDTGAATAPTGGGPDTASDSTPPASGMPASDPPSTDTPSTATSDQQESGDADDSVTNDPTLVTLGAVVGAVLLLAVAVWWMVRMNRSDDDLAVDDLVGDDDGDLSK